MAPGPFDKAAIVRHVLDKAELGGAVLDVDVLDRALACRHRGLQIHKIYFSVDPRPPHAEAVGTSSIHYHPVTYRPDLGERELPRLVEALRQSFTKIAERYAPILFVNHVPEQQSGFFLSRLARECGLPVMSVFHGGNRPALFASEEHARAVDLVRANLRASAGLSDLVAAVSDSAAAILPLSKVHNLRTGVDARFFDPARVAAGYLRRRFRDDHPLPILVLAARIVPEKGHRLLLEASQILFERGCDHRLVFVGSATPQMRSEFESYLVGNGFGGVASVIYDATQEEMVSIYRDADVVVLPGFHLEGCPRCLIEAGLMAVPVVATNAGGTREAFVPDETGVLVPVGDARALADALGSLMLDPARRVAMGQAGRRWASLRFDLDALAERHELLYARLVSGVVAPPERSTNLSMDAVS